MTQYELNELLLLVAIIVAALALGVIIGMCVGLSMIQAHRYWRARAKRKEARKP